MRALAIGDRFIPASVLSGGLSALAELGYEATIREWFHPDLAAIQEDNLAIEQRGPDAVVPPPELVADIADYELLIVQFFPVGGALLEKAKKLRHIGILRAGIENVDRAAATARGVEIIPTPGRNARAVAEFTVGMIIAETRNIARAHAALKSGDFRKSFPNSDRIPELYGRRIGLVGLGNIGSLVAKYLAPFDCELLVYDPFLPSLPPGLTPCGDLDSLLSAADVVCMHMRLTDQTRHMIGPAQLAKMKPTAYLINTARAGLVDEKALVKALRDKTIMGAALDVFENEPPAGDDPLLGLDNLTLTTHLAGSTIDSFVNTPRLFCEIFAKTVFSDFRR
ncbi:MAG: 2-hydroxyacid dehydrogenase [Planctomycetota bacterium]|jgi:D-3-phosphoglycerate dehydrogenase|nr:2-hydroxyacid dehydrogenase [Planctomycetota bacterium]